MMPARSANLPQDFLTFNAEKKLFKKNMRIGLAVSGGLDSVVMLTLFAGLRADFHLDLVVLHFNHKLRQEADADAAFVAELSAQHSLPFVSESAEVVVIAKQQKLSIETAARQCRYHFFERMAIVHQLDRIATAHTANDQAETVLGNVMRGAGLTGLSGIPVRRGKIIRPLLFATRTELEGYAHEHHLSWRNDSTNADQRFTRNRIRHSLLPFIQKNFNPQIVEALNRLANSAAEADLMIHEAAEAAWQTCITQNDDEKIVLEIDRFLAYVKSLQRIVLGRVLEELGENPQVINANTLDALVDFFRKQAGGASFAISGHLIIVISGQKAVFERTRDSEEHFIAIDKKPGIYPLWDGLFLEIKESAKPLTWGNKNRAAEYVDADLLKPPLIVRAWKEADFFYPINGAGKRKLSDFFIDLKVEYLAKADVPILESAGSIVWICGQRLDDRFKITGNTGRVFKLTIGQRERQNDI